MTLRRAVVFSLAAGAAVASGCSSVFDGAPDSDLRYGTLQGPLGSFQAHYTVDGDYAVVGGDMLYRLPDEDVPQLAGFTSEGPKSLWPKGVVPYTIDDDTSAADRAVIDQAIAAWNRVSASTGVELQPRTDQRDYVHILASANVAVNSSGTGVTGFDQPLILYSPVAQSSAEHELGHAIGLQHEHQRPDRPLRIIESNIQPQIVSQYDVVEGGTLLGAYDFRSIMHYKAIGGGDAIDRDQPTMEATDGTPTTSIGGDTISSGDVAAVSEMYAAISDFGCVNPCDAFGVADGACQTIGGTPYQCDAGCLIPASICQQLECANRCVDSGIAEGQCAFDQGGDAYLCVDGCLERNECAPVDDDGDGCRYDCDDNGWAPDECAADGSGVLWECFDGCLFTVPSC
jgi:hypothetical protein